MTIIRLQNQGSIINSLPQPETLPELLQGAGVLVQGKSAMKTRLKK
jgi:hypothetical protein